MASSSSSSTTAPSAPVSSTARAEAASMTALRSLPRPTSWTWASIIASSLWDGMFMIVKKADLGLLWSLAEVANVIEGFYRLDVKFAVARHLELLAGAVGLPVAGAIEAHLAHAADDFHDFR